MNNQGLLNKNLDEVKIDKSLPKIIILAVIGIIFSFFFGYFLKLFILNGNLNFLLFCFLAGAGFLTFLLLDIFFVKSFWRVSLIIFLETLAFLLVFYNQLSLTIGGATLFSFLILLLADYSGRQELENTLKIKLWRISKKVLPKAIVGLALFSSVAYINAIGFGQKEFFISQSAFEKILYSATEPKIIQNFLPGFDISLPSGELISNLARDQIEQNPQSKLLPESTKKQLINQTVKELEKKISDFTGQPINSKTRASQGIYELLVNKFNQLSANTKDIIPIGIVAFIFLIIISLTLPIRWFVTILAFLIYEIFLAFGFSVILAEGRSREIIVLK